MVYTSNLAIFFELFIVYINYDKRLSSEHGDSATMVVCKSLFASHGSFSIELTDKCMIVDASGPFNKEIVDEYETAIQAAMETLTSKHWGQIIRLHGMSMFTPDAENKLVETVKSRKQHGLKASAILIEDVEAKSLIIQQMSRVYEHCGVNFKFFEGLDDGLTWINQTV